MKWLMTASIVCLAFSYPGSAAAQDQNPAVLAFHDFFDAFIGSEWTYHTQMTGPDGATQFEGTDIRTYRYGMRGRYVIEDVFNLEEDGARTHAAVQLIGVDTSSGAIRISQFWPWQPTILGDVSAGFTTGDGGQRGLSGVARPAGKDHPTFEFECAFESDDLYRCVTQTTSEDGTTYRSNVETFTRRH